MLIFAGGAILLYGVVGGLIAPPIAKRMIASKLSETLGRAVEIDKVSVNPYTLVATVDGFRILETDRKTPFVSFDRLEANASITSLTRLAPVVDEMTLDGLKVGLIRDGENHYNASDILARLAARPKAKDEDPARFSVSNIRIAKARIDFDDRPQGVKHQVTDIDLAIPFVSNLPRHLKDLVQPRLSANVNGAPLNITGETLPFEDSLRTHVALQLEGLELPRYAGYSPSPLPVKLDAGKLEGRIEVRFTQKSPTEPALDLSGQLELTGLAVSGPDGKVGGAARVEAQVASFDPLGGKGVIQSLRLTDVQVGEPWRVASVEAAGIHFDLRAKDLRVDSVAKRGGVVALQRRADGSIEMPVRVANTGGSAEPSGPPWHVVVAKATLDDYRVTLSDASVKPAATHHISIAHVEARNLSTEKGAKVLVTARLGLEKSGSVDVESSIVFNPLLVDAKVDARRIDFVPLRPYVQYFSTVKVKSALASAKGRVQLRGAGKNLKVAYAGSAELAKVATFETVSGEDLLNWDSVRADRIAFSWAQDEPVKVAVGDIAVKKLYSRVVVTPEGKLNLQQLKQATGEKPAPEPQPQEDLKPRNVRIDRISFVDSRLNFTDLFIKPNYTADVGELNGSVTGLSSDPSTRGVVDLKGSYDKSSPVVIAGTINPLSGDLFLDIAGKGQDIELRRLSAYSVRYAGYGITQGRLTLDVKYHIEGGKLEGRNKILLDQLTFGDKVEGPDATSLPVLFAVNLLKDSQGRIDLELPINGSLSDPQFDVGGLIAQVVGNLLKKALTSPFSLLTAAFGGGGGGGAASAAGPAGSAGDDLAFISFEAGRDEASGAERAKLEQITKALLDRPAVRIEMASHVDREKDLAALKRAALQAKLREAKGGPIAEAEYPRYLKAAYEKEFPPAKPARDGAKEAPAKDAPAKEPTTAEMEARLLEKLQVGDEQLRGLATRRAEWVKGYLTAQGRLPSERVLLAAAQAGDVGTRVSRVEFTLK
ncbi:MAG: DUF748 domain-containing protein [Burkholderiales bacterium]|nr:DUF748 domain-containing protein [Burkholderiales bacterium]